MKNCLLMIKNLCILVLFATLSTTLHAQQKTIALTIDDLPFVGEYRNQHLKMMIDTMKQQQITATGFIIAHEVRHDNWPILHEFKDAGFDLGNHTYSHANLGRLSTHDAIAEIKKADTLLAPVLTKPKYFRYPYLSMNTGAKREALLCYLAKKHYKVAPITIDSKDFVFNQRLLSVPELQRRDYFNYMKPFYLEFIQQQTKKAEEHSQYHHNPEQAQILLIHANLLNAYVLPDIIKLYKEQGYEFITLTEALKSYKESIRCKSKITDKPSLPVNQSAAMAPSHLGD